MQTEAKHSQSGSVIYTDAPKDHDGEGKDLSKTDLLASSLYELPFALFMLIINPPIRAAFIRLSFI